MLNYFGLVHSFFVCYCELHAKCPAYNGVPKKTDFARNLFLFYLNNSLQYILIIYCISVCRTKCCGRGLTTNGLEQDYWLCSYRLSFSKV